MTPDEFKSENAILIAHFPVLDSTPGATWVAWYASFEKWPVGLYRAAIRLVCRSVPSWHKGMNLRGVVGQVESEANEEYRRAIARMAEMSPARRLEDGSQTSLEEAKANLAKIRDIFDEIDRKYKIGKADQ